MQENITTCSGQTEVLKAELHLTTHHKKQVKQIGMDSSMSHQQILEEQLHHVSMQYDEANEEREQLTAEQQQLQQTIDGLQQEACILQRRLHESQAIHLQLQESEKLVQELMDEMEKLRCSKDELYDSCCSMEEDISTLQEELQLSKENENRLTEQLESCHLANTEELPINQEQETDQRQILVTFIYTNVLYNRIYFAYQFHLHSIKDYNYALKVKVCSITELHELQYHVHDM